MPQRRQRALWTATAAIVLASAAGAAELRELPVRGVGFIGPIGTGNPPETAICGNLRYQGSVGFPYRNRSLVVDFGKPTLVHSLKLLDDNRDNDGTSPTIADGGLLLYTSDDNRTFTRYRGNVKTTIRSGAPEGVFDVVEISGLAIFARYVKLHADRPDERWDFGNNNLQKMVRAYQDASLAAQISRIQLPRYSVGRALLTADVEMPQAKLGELSLELSQDNAPLATVAVESSGQCRGHVDVSALPSGPYTFHGRLITKTGTTLATCSAKTYVATGLIHDPPTARSLAGRPGQAVMLTKLGQYTDLASARWSPGTFRHVQDATAQPLFTAKKDAGRLVIRLPAKGWHAVTLGLLDGESEIDARLGAEGTFKRCRLQVWRQHERPEGLGEAFVGCADLNGSTLTLRPVSQRPCRLAFVRLLGLAQEQVRLAKAAAEPNHDRRVTVNNDGFSMFFSGVDSKEKLYRLVDQYGNQRLYSFDYCTGSDASCTYATKVGTVFGTYKDTFWRQGDRRAYDNIQKLIAAGDDPLKVVIDRCHAQGLRVHVSFRACANYAPPMADTFNGELYWKHYNCRITMRSGQQSSRLSYAYPEVKAFRVALIKEAVGYGPDGLHLDFLRHPPFVGYDEPLVATFRQRYGVDPRTVPEDERWYGLCAEVMTGFVRDVHRVLDEAGQAAGRRLTLSASFDYANYRQQGLDVERWVKEGLVDDISPGRHGLGGIYFSAASFAQMVRGTPCKLFPRLEHTIAGHDPTPQSERGEVTYESEYMTLNLYRARALELYDEGADGVYLFNTSGLGFINALSHVAGLRAWDAFERPFVGWWGPVLQ